MTISLSALRPADIIVSTTDAAVSAVIRAGSGSSVSHSMLYIGGGAVVEAVDVGVLRRPLADALQGAVLAIALRRRNLTEKQRTDVLAHAIRFAGSSLPYDTVGAAGPARGPAGVVCWRGSAARSACYCVRRAVPRYVKTRSPRTRIDPSSAPNSSHDASSWRAHPWSKARLRSRRRATFALRPHFCTWASSWTRPLLRRLYRWPPKAARLRALTGPAASSRSAR
jgi:hypothetical protein